MSNKIMIVDDEASVCELLSRLFKDAGYTVNTANDPLEGLKIIEKERPNCVVLDIKMPKVDGVEVLSRIKQIDKKIGVVMITAYGNLETAMESMKLGAYDYVTKPFNLEFIKVLVAKCIEDANKKA